MYLTEVRLNPKFHKLRVAGVEVSQEGHVHFNRSLFNDRFLNLIIEVNEFVAIEMMHAHKDNINNSTQVIFHLKDDNKHVYLQKVVHEGGSFHALSVSDALTSLIR